MTSGMVSSAKYCRFVFIRLDVQSIKVSRADNVRTLLLLCNKTISKSVT